MVFRRMALHGSPDRINRRLRFRLQPAVVFCSVPCLRRVPAVYWFFLCRLCSRPANCACVFLSSFCSFPVVSACRPDGRGNGSGCQENVTCFPLFPQRHVTVLPCLGKVLPCLGKILPKHGRNVAKACGLIRIRFRQNRLPMANLPLRTPCGPTGMAFCCRGIPESVA